MNRRNHDFAGHAGVRSWFCDKRTTDTRYRPCVHGYWRIPSTEKLLNVATLRTVESLKFTASPTTALGMEMIGLPFTRIHVVPLVE